MPPPESMTIEDWKDLARRCRQWAKDAKKKGDRERTAHWNRRAEELEQLVRKLEKEEAENKDAVDFWRDETWWYQLY